jgi:amino acid transporter/nucleotide-binding universal stress UspA family protein
MPEKDVGGVEFELRRDLGFFDITMIGIGAMIGAGIFVLTGYAIDGAGPAAIVVFLLNGLVAILTALTYMELGSCFPQAGGSYLWVREGMPHPFGFLSGWMDWMAHTIACSLYALGFGSYLSWWFVVEGITFGSIPPDWMAKLFAVLVAIILLSVNYMGTGTTGKAENIATVAKLIILFIFIGFGVYAVFTNPYAMDNFTKDFFPRGFGGIAYGMGLTFIAFQGFEVITQCGEEVKDPRKNIPKAIIISLVVVIIIYITIAIVAIGAVNSDPPGHSWRYFADLEDKELAMVEAAKVFMGPLGFLIMVIGGLVSTISALNATVFSSSRVSFAMGRDGTLPPSLGKIHPQRRTPSNAIFLTGIMLIIIAITLPIADVAAAAGIMFLMLFSFANISLITLRRKMPYLQRGFVVPLVPLIPLIATGVNITVAIYLFLHSPVSWYIAIVWIEFGLIGYYFTRGKEEITEIDKVEKLIGVPRRETGKDYHVLVPIANPKSTELIDFGSTVARHKNGDMILLNIAAIPDTIPIKNVDYEFVNRRVKTAEGLSEYATSKHNIITRARVVVSHKIRDTILEIVNKEKANITIIGWSGKPARSRILFGYNIDDIIQYATSDVAVLKGPIKGEIKKILLIPGDGIHGQHAAEFAAYLAHDNNATVSVAGILTPEKAESDIRAETRVITDIIRNFGVQADEKIITTKRPVATIISTANDYDFLMLGASEKWKMLRYAFGPIQDSVAKKAEVPFLILRAYEKEYRMLSTSELGDEDEKIKILPTKSPKPEIPQAVQPPEAESTETETPSEGGEVSPAPMAMPVDDPSETPDSTDETNTENPNNPSSVSEPEQTGSNQESGNISPDENPGTQDEDSPGSDEEDPVIADKEEDPSDSISNIPEELEDDEDDSDGDDEEQKDNSAANHDVDVSKDDADTQRGDKNE